MTVYLVRHAKAEKAAPRGGGDAERRLTPDGRHRFRDLLASLGPRLAATRVVSSPFVRARETADLVSAATGAPMTLDPELASGRPSGRDLLAAARRAGAGAALVGHNPEIAEAIALAAGEERKVRPGTVAAIELDGRGARLLWLEAPARDEE